MVNGNSYFINQLWNGDLSGHNVNGSNILITSNPMNNSQYLCTDGISSDGGVYHIVVAGEYADLFVCIHMSHIHTKGYEK